VYVSGYRQQQNEEPSLAVGCTLQVFHELMTTSGERTARTPDERLKRSVASMMSSLVEVIKAIALVVYTRARVQHRVLRNSSTCGNLQNTSLFTGRIVGAVAFRAHAGNVCRKDDPVLAAVNESRGSRVGDCDVCFAREERDPPPIVTCVSGKGGLRRGCKTHCTFGALCMPALNPGGSTE
jgi:hypothetical protein